MVVINITGQICAGKTSLARRLGERFGLPVFSIDDYRLNVGDESAAWCRLYDDAGRCADLILDSSGLNSRLRPLLGGDVVTVKLVCGMGTALRRLRVKGEYAFSFPYAEFRSHEDFVRFWSENQHRIVEDLRVDSGRLAPDEVFERVVGFLEPKLRV